MASVTLAEFRTRARRRADMENSTFIADAELSRYVNDSISELYDLLIQTRGENYYVSSNTFSTVAGTASYSLPNDFLKLMGVDWNQSSNEVFTLSQFMWQERNRYNNPLFYSNYFGNTRYQIRGNNLVLTPVPTGVNSITLWYIPRFAELSSDGATFDGINGWEEYVVIDAAIKMRVKEESDVQELLLAKQDMKQRIQAASAGRNSAEPPKVVDTSKTARPWW